jgi:hypothetical protein
LSSQQVRQNREDIDLRHIVGVHDSDRVGGILFSQNLIAQHSEGNHNNPDWTVVGENLLQQGLVNGRVVGVELNGMHRRRPSGCDSRCLLGQVIAAPSG